MEQYKYDFSIIISVFNVEEYIEEALESLLKQDFNMARVQFILVDDGSTDGSGKYCDDFKKKHYENTIVIHKENGGLSSARMAGIPILAGKYVSFFDPDDILSSDTLKSVFSFFEEHEGETEVVAIPIQFFGDLSGAHPLNNKFERGSRVIDLSVKGNTNISQMSVASAFFTRRAVALMNFDTEIVTAEDAIEMVKILLEKQTLGVVANATYYYRKRKTSNVGGAKYKKNWYIAYLEHFSEWAFKYCLQKLGYIPRFVQYTVMYDLQWKLLQQHIPEGILDEQEKQTYQKKLYSLAQYVDDDIILQQKHIFIEQKIFFLYNKYKLNPNIISNVENGHLYFEYQKKLIYDALNLVSYINFVTVKEKEILIEGSVLVCNVDLGEPEMLLKVGDNIISAQEGKYKDIIYSADIPIAKRKSFVVSVPRQMISNHTLIQVISKYKDFEVVHKRIIYGKHAPVTHRCANSYYQKDNIMIRPAKGGLQIDICNTKQEALRSEKKYLISLIKSKKKEAKKAAIARTLYHAVKPFVPKNIWLVTDKSDRADDNGEAFFKYLMENKKEDCTPVFAISKKSPDYIRMKQIGKVVPYMSWRHKMLHLLAAHTVSAYSHNEITSPFLNYSYYYSDLLQSNHVVFLQHGIIKDDLSKSLNRPHKNFSLFVTSTERERNAVLTDNYGYEDEQIILTGLPRYDRLYNKPMKKITIMPTWLRSLFGDYDPKTSKWVLLPGFEDSQYYQFYNGLLNSQKLLDYAEKKGYVIQFLAHPVLFPYLSYFKPDKRVVILNSEVCYRDVFAESSLITTDYSSVAFDFAYLEKPVIYTQFEANHYQEGYFDYEKDGFGEVEHTHDDAVDRIIEYIDNDCVIKEKYLNRIHSFFAYHDKRNCERVFNKIKEYDMTKLK